MRPLVPQSWLFSARLDTGVFLGAALASVVFALITRSHSDTPLWAWLLVVVLIDVAHVWGTLFRVYFDGAELRRRPLLYVAAPLFAWAVGVAIHAVSSALFWRVLAYVAVWHFIRQQLGWMALYGRRAGSDRVTLRLDAAAMLAATLGPVVWWHAHLPRPFWWFREDDFLPGLPAWCGTVALAADAVVLVVWVACGLRSHRFHVGKSLLLLATWISWFGGIVVAESDLAFTVLNVVLHGVPYFALLYRNARGRLASERPAPTLRALMGLGVVGFFAVVWGLAFLEELGWDRLVWHDHPQLFGDSDITLSSAVATVLVPLLALPQTTHYVLDGFVWRGRDNPQLAVQLGWSPGRVGNDGVTPLSN